MDRTAMLDKVEAIYAAREKGDFAVLDSVLAPGAEFSFAGADAITRRFPGGEAGSIEGVAKALFASLDLLEREQLHAIVEGRKAAVMWHCRFQLPGGQPFEGRLYDLWEFDDEERICRGTQFFDTALLVTEMEAVLPAVE
jgi:ketosteroid isomerase-like protein